MTDDLEPRVKIAFAMQKAAARLEHFQNILVAVSGGADSDVMLDLLLRVCPKEKMTFVFFDTGVEYGATKKHLDFIEQKYGITIEKQRATVPVPLGVKKYGLPFISKAVSAKIHILQNNNFDFAGDGWKSADELREKYPNCRAIFGNWWCAEGNGRYSINRLYKLKEFLIANPPTFKISDDCCSGAKKITAHKYERQGNFDCKCMGLRQAEGGVRSTAYKNCYTFDPSVKMQNMRPIWWFTDADKAEYISQYDVKLSDCYTVYGMKRTGCAGCPLNSRFEEDLQILQRHEPKLYRAAVAIFGESYDYSRQYREFKETERKKEKTGGQQTIFDYMEGVNDDD